jgi:hypothetical protein
VTALPRARRAAALSAASAGAVVVALVAAPAGAAPVGHVKPAYARIAGTTRAPRGALKIGVTSTSKRIAGVVALAPRDPAALAAEAKAVSDPHSARFHQFLSPTEFANEYAPTAATITAVKSTLSASNLAVTSVSRNGMLVHFSGSVGSAESAFRTQLSDFRLANGRVATNATTALSFPASIASSVTAVVGLDNVAERSGSFRRATQPAARKAVTSKLTHYKGAPSACSTATAAANAYGGLTDDQIAHAYGVDGLYKHSELGTGQTVGIVEFEPFLLSDVKAFDSCYYGASEAAAMTGRIVTTTVDGGAGVGPGSGESILDVEDVQGLAPGATVNVYEAPNSDSGSLDMLNQMVQDNNTVISNSWGICEPDLLSAVPGAANAENTIFEQAALQGESVFSSAGDSGSDDCARGTSPTANPLGVDDPASQPYVTAVGGTTITNANVPIDEQVWNDGAAGGGGGGGVSQIWGAQSWQQSFLDTTSAANAVTDTGLTACASSPSTAAACREVPDVSAQADEYTGAITIYSAEFGGWTTFGGTSSATPLWAAMIADTNSTAGCAATKVGFVSPELYALAAVPATYKASFTDIKLGNNDVYDVATGDAYATRAGYDMASGLGSPRLTTGTSTLGLAGNLCSLASAAAPSITSISPAVIDASTTGSMTISGTGFASATGLSIGNYEVPASDRSVTATTIVVSPIPTALQAGDGGLVGPNDGTGRALVSVTGPNGVTSRFGPSSTVMYVKNATASVPTVSGLYAWGGRQGGGNQVTVLGAGFTDAADVANVTKVTVGGVAATNVSVVDSDKLTATIPAYASGTTACVGSQNPATDVCQAQVVVSNANGDSDTSTILPAASGAPFEGVSDGSTLPECATGHTCELVPANSEYDYYPTPTISSVTTTSAGDPTVWVSEKGTTTATINGTGFDPFSVNWVNVGSTTDPNSQAFEVLSITPTRIVVVLPGHELTVEPVSKNLTVASMAGLSAPTPVKYAGVPVVSEVTPPAGPIAGGTLIKGTGKGFQGIALADGGGLAMVSAIGAGSASANSGYHAVSDTTLQAKTPASTPGATYLSVCTVTGCSEPKTLNEFIDSSFEYYPPGDPVVTGTSVKRGPAAGGTHVVISGRNLSDAVEVFFGSRLSKAHSGYALLTNGSSTRIDAVAPPGAAGAKVSIVVVTVESLVEGLPSKKTSAATFTYAPSVSSPPRSVKAHTSGTTVKVSWSAPLSTGGHAITKYRVSAVAQANGAHPHAKRPRTVSATTKAKTHSASLKHLRGGWTYVVHVAAVNAKGTSHSATSTNRLTIVAPA